VTFKKGETVIFYDQPVTFLEYHGQNSSKIMIGEDAEELVSTNLKGETFVSTRLLRRESEYPIKMIEEINYYVSTTRKNEASFMKRFFPKEKFTLLDLYVGTVCIRVSLRDDGGEYIAEDIDAVDFFSWFDDRGNYACKTE
jgi:hypothetical protein